MRKRDAWDLEKLFAEDLRPQTEYALGSHHVDERQVVSFAEQWDPQYFHTDPSQAATTPFGGVIASGIHSLAIFQRLCVPVLYSRWNTIAGRSISEVRFLKPVLPGMTLLGRATIDSVAPRDDGRALVSVTGFLKHDAATVLEVRVDTVVARRPPHDHGRSVD